MPDFIQSVVLIGAGNVAWHLGLALKKKKIDILQVLGRTIEPVKELAGILKADYTLDFEKIDVGADLYIISVSDDALADITAKLYLREQLVVHTAGSIPMSVFKEKFKYFGVFYPLQTFTKGREIQFDKVPVCVEANEQRSLNKLVQLAGQISETVLVMNSEKRARLHLAAVFASNFTNHMYSIANRILKKDDIDFSILHPLIIETAMKATGMKPAEAQTGPAIRKDRILMEKQMKMLNNDPSVRDIYQILSDNIRNYLTDEL